MPFRFAFRIGLVAVLLLALFAQPIYAQEERPPSLLVMDADSGRVLYESEGRTLRYPASITKIMTALVVLENEADLARQIPFSQRAVTLPHYAGRMGVEAGDSLTVFEALHALLVVSANEVANALAEHVAGDIPAFVRMMNRRAAELGAVHTHFVNPCGLPGDGQHTTAFDMALIMREAVTHPLFVQIVSTEHFYVSPTHSRPEGWHIRNDNRLIRPDDAHFNPLVVGSKTGFTNAAQHTLVTYAQQGGRRLIVSVLFTPRLFTFAYTNDLLAYAFALPTLEPEPAPALEPTPLLDEPEVFEPGAFDREAFEFEVVPAMAVPQAPPPAPAPAEPLDYTEPPIYAGFPVPERLMIFAVGLVLMVGALLFPLLWFSRPVRTLWKAMRR